MSKKKIVFVALITVLLIETVIIWASGTQDYRTIDFKDDKELPILKPTAQFTLTHNGTKYESPVGTNLDSFEVAVNATVGDIVTIQDFSHSNREQKIKEWDFQYSRPDGTNEKIKTKAFEKSYRLDKPGTYTFSLCVRDTVEDEAWTYYWGNWSDNGNHQVIGHNPGKNLSDPSDDFDGYWYFTRIVVIARNPTYSLEEKHIDTITGEVLSETLHKEITSNSFTTTKENFDGYDFVGSRAGYTWSDIANGTTENISSRTANFTNMKKNAFHYYYYKRNTPPTPPPPGKADIIVYYKDKISGEAVYPEDTSLMGVDYGTYTITAPPAPSEYTFDSASTPSPQIVTVNAANNYKEIIFYYKPNTVVQKKRPVAILTGPEQVMAGDDFKVSAKDSYATEPGATIKYYLWDINRYTPSWPPIEDRDKTVTLWSDAVEGDYCGVEVTVVDSNGMTDDDRISIEVLPAEPTPVITITGDLRENRKVTLSAANSKAPKHFPIDTSKTKWEITAVSGGTAADIKYKGSLTGATTVDTLYKKAGKYHIKLTVELTVGVPRSTEMDITIKPDLPPIADFSTPTTIYRNPKDSNNAAAIITNLSTSPDGDPIWKSACLEVYDSDNDGNFDEETCYYSVNGNSWLTTGKTYAQIKASGFDIFSLTDSNPGTYTHKSKQVGKYIYEITVIEGIPESTTIPEFISINDYRRNNTWQ